MDPNPSFLVIKASITFFYCSLGSERFYFLFHRSIPNIYTYPWTTNLARLTTSLDKCSDQEQVLNCVHVLIIDRAPHWSIILVLHCGGTYCLMQTLTPRPLQFPIKIARGGKNLLHRCRGSFITSYWPYTQSFYVSYLLLIVFSLFFSTPENSKTRI